MGPLAQVAPGPLDTLRFPLEQQLLDMVRHGEQDYCKGRPEQAARAPSCYAEYRGPAGALEDALARQARGRAFSGRRLRSLTPLCPCAARGFSRRKGRPWAASGCRERSGLCLGAGKSPFFLDGAELVLEEQRCSPKGGDVAAGAERYSRKVFVGGLPPDIDEEEITASFRRFGPLVVDWPHKAESKSYFPPKGYAFLLFQDECSVQALMDACIQEEDKLYLCVSSPTIKDKPVQIRPWRLGDADFVLDASLPLDPRKTVFVGGVPRPLKAVELAMIMDRLYGGVCYAGIDTDPELKYPKGAGRVAFSNQQSYIAAISARFVQLQHGDIEKRVGACAQGRLRGRHQKGNAGGRIIKRGARLENEGGGGTVAGVRPGHGVGPALLARARQTLQHALSQVEVKPYVLDDQMCDECQGARCGGKFAPFFCANVTCLQYYCEHCWATIHSRPGREFHKPLVKEGADRPRAVPFRWC